MARAKAAGGGVIELPAKWIRLTRGFSVPGGTLVTCRGRAALDMMDRGKAIFVVPDGADVAFKNIMFVGGGCAIASAAANGRVRAVGCGFYGQASASIRAESRKPASFAVDVTGGQAYTPALYRGNAKFTMDALWYQMSCAGDREHTPRDHAAIVNLEGGEMRVREMLGVPVYFQWFGKDGVDRDDFVAAHMGDYRWFDNSGLLLSFSNRTGGEYHGLTPIYHHGRATTYVEGGVAEFSLRALRPGRWTVLAADTPDADVTIVDLLSHSHRQPLAVMWSDGGEYRPLSSARMSNTFPFGYRQ